MNKKQKTAINITLLLAVLLGILIYSGALPFALSSGFTTLSLGQVDFYSNDPTVGGQAWLLTVSQNGAGQYASGVFKAQDDGATSNQFVIETFLDKNYATYSISNQAQYVQHVDYKTATYNPLSSTGGCGSGWNWYHPSEIAIVGTVYCYKFSNSGVLGAISSGNYNFQSTIRTSGSGGVSNCIVSNIGATSCTSPDGNVAISWAGNLVSGQSIPAPSDQNIIAVYHTSKGGWITADKNAYNNWNIAKSNINSCLDQYKSTSCFTSLNSLESNVLAGKSFSSSGGSVATTSGTQSSGQITLPLSTQVQFPILTMRIKASLIGINIPVGKPQITSVSSEKFQTGQDGIIKVTVKNVGTGAGSFDVSATCSNGFYQKGNTLRISSLSVGSSSTVYIPITSNVVSGSLAGSCSVKANDVNNPNNVDTESVSVSSSAITICSAGEKRISGNDIQQCQNNVWTTIQSCSSTEEAKYVGSTPQCVVKGTTGSSLSPSQCAWYDVSCKVNKFFTGLNKILTMIKWIVLLALSLLSFILSKNFIDKIIRNKDKTAKIITIIVSLLLAFAVGAALYLVLLTSLFWIIVISLVIVQLILKFVPLAKIFRR